MENILYKINKLNGIPNYGIDIYGNVYNLKTNQKMKSKVNKDGYLVIVLRVNGVKKNFTIHRLVATAFIPNVNNFPVINHIDGNKLNNIYTNLEWTTVKQNTIHGYELELSSLTVRVMMHDIVTDIKNEYRSIQHLAEVLNVNHKLLISYIKHSDRYPFMGKYIIKVLDENKLIENLNSSNFGKPIYVYDIIANSIKKYNSIGIASYYTGLRSLSKLSYSLLEEIGFFISYNDFKTKPLSMYHREVLIKNRELYLSRPYTPRFTKVVTVDLMDKNKEIRYYETISEFKAEIYKKHNIDIGNITITDIKIRPTYTSRLFLGYNIQLVNDFTKLSPWSDYSKQEIVNSRYQKNINSPVYVLKIMDQKPVYVFGTFALLTALKCYIKNTNIFNREMAKIKIIDIYKAIDNTTNVSIERL